MNYEASKSADVKLLREVVGVIALGEERTAPNANKHWLSVLLYYNICAGIRSKAANDRIKEI